MFKHHRTQWGLATPRGLAWVFLLSLLMGLFLFGCDDTRLGPVEADLEPKDYAVWFYQMGVSHKLHAYHPKTKLLETTEIPWDSDGSISVSPDGDLLYLPIEGGVAVLETDSLSLVETLPYDLNGIPWGRVMIAPDGEYLAIIGRDSVWILDRNYSQVHSEPFAAFTASFSADSRTLYAASMDILVIEITDSAFNSHVMSVPSRSVIQALPTPDKSRLLTNSMVGFDRWVFEVYDIAADSNLYGQLNIPGGGFVTMSPNGRFAYFGNPGSIIIGAPSTNELFEYDIDANEIVVTTIEYDIDSLTTYKGAFYDPVITPDGRWLVAIDGPDQSAFWSYDLVNREFTDFRQLAFELVRNCAVQSQP